ncbi:MAG: DUF2207 domain-containing protein [Gemmatimonadota bacterium]
MRIRWMAHVGLALALLGAVASNLAAQERILSYDSEIQILPDGEMEVTERIRIRAEGNQIRRGIYRDFPTRYRDRYGNRVRVDFEVLGVERDGVPEPWFTESLSNGVRLNTGNDDFLAVPAEYTFHLRYRTSRQLGFFDEHDELYWNAIGTGWIFPIEAGTVEVHLPEPVPVSALSAEGYTGPQGAQGTAYSVDFPEPGVASYRLTEPLRPQEGFTIVLTFPKGIVPEPTRGDRLRWLLADNRGLLIALAGLLGLLAFTFWRWNVVGRDPASGIVIARYDPPEELTPAGIRYLRRMGYDDRCFTGDLLELAVKGRLHISQKKGFLKDEWTLHAGPAPGASPTGELELGQESLLDHLFPGGKRSLKLKNTNASIFIAARRVHEAVLKDRFIPSHFQRHQGEVGWATLLVAITSGLAFFASGGFGIPGIVIITGVMVVILVIFGLLVRAPSPQGRKVLDEIEGLALYLSVAEKDDLARMQGPGESPPPLDAGRFETLLPFAVALEVEEAWTDKFTAAVGAVAAAEATSRISWYRGGRMANPASLTKALGSSLNSQISSSSTPPGSSSGSGGGGSSGGGGGGGGGGGR